MTWLKCDKWYNKIHEENVHCATVDGGKMCKVNSELGKVTFESVKTLKFYT